MKYFAALVSFLSLAITTAIGTASIPGFPDVPEDLLKVSSEIIDTQEICTAINIYSRGYNLIGVFHLPTTQMPAGGFPTVLLFHGFRGSKYGGASHPYRKLAQKLAQNGIACIRVDMAGCGDSEGHAESIEIRTYLANGEDILAAVSNYPEVNPFRLGAAGFSLGCHTALHLASLYEPSHFTLKSLSLWAPIADGGILLKELYDQYKLNKENAAAIGKGFGIGPLPLVVRPRDIEDLLKIQDHVVANSLPTRPYILHQQGEKDDIVSLTQRSLFQKTAPGKMSFQVYQDTGHSIEDSPYFDEIMQEIITHFTRTL
ncbi:alpha/beta hydrolase [Chlamydia pecorum]|uniref:alpha/beta hydrolase n=1 Tax=Chlamydia pecorum TaxID=85991 RepID=UPI00388FA9A2